MNVFKAAGKFENFTNLNLPVSSLYLLAVPSTPPEVVDKVIERAQAGEKLTTAEIKQYVRPVERPAAPPAEVSVTITKSAETSRGFMAPKEETRAEILARQLGYHLPQLADLLGDDFDEAAEILIAKGIIDRTTFKKIGAALSLVGNTIQGNRTRTAAAATADKYCPPKSKPH